MTEDDDDTSSWLDDPPADQAIINEVFIKGFHTLYKIQIGELKTVALFDTGTLINTILFKFFSTLQQQLNVIPTNRKVVSAEGDSLGPIGEVHIKFKIGNIVFHDRFIILNSLQCDIILRLPWQQNYRIGCTWNREGKHFVTIKNQFLVLSIAPHILWQLARPKGQCTLQHRAVIWISIQTPRTLDTNSLFKIGLDWQLPKGIVPLDVLHNINHKQPHELLIPILDMTSTDVELLKNTVLGLLTRVNNMDYIHNVSCEKMETTSNKIQG